MRKIFAFSYFRKMSKTYKAFAPATISNLGSGFDLLGLCLEHPGDHVYASIGDKPGVSIHQIRGYKSDISSTANSAITAVEAMLSSLDMDHSISLVIEKGYAHSSGLGSSAASAVAAVIAVNSLLKKPFKQKEQLYPFALAGERHRDPGLPADNVAASLFGGIVLSHPFHRPIILPVPDGLFLTVVRPDIRIDTSSNRSSLPANIPLADMIEQSYALSNLVLGLYRSDLELIGRGLNDHIIEKHRSKTIPRFDQLKSLAISAGALGCSISGSGPAVFALSPNSFIAEEIKDHWSGIPSLEYRDSDLFVSGINLDGAHLC